MTPKWYWLAAPILLVMIASLALYIFSVVGVAVPVQEWPGIGESFKYYVLPLVLYVAVVLGLHYSRASKSTLHDRPEPRNRGIAIVLAFLLGGIGAHRFYMGRIATGLLYVAFCWTSVPFILGIAEAIAYALIDDDRFQSLCRK